MDMLLAKNEQQVESWNYAKINGLLFKKGESSLVLTDKRLISLQQTKKIYNRTDIDLKDISGMHISFINPLKIYMIIVLLFAVIGFLIVIPFILLHFVLVGRYKIKYDITILINGIDNELLDVEATGGKGQKKLRFVVNEPVCKEIVKDIMSVIGDSCKIEYNK